MHDGSVIFWRGGLLVGPIYRFTNSLLTHVAIILDNLVYEATPPRVRRMPLQDYYQHLSQLSDSAFFRRRDFSWFTLQPKNAFNSSQLAAMKAYAVSQLGRPYRLRSWFTEAESRGIFCSQYIGNIIAKSGLIVSANNHESPVSLYRKLVKFYD